MSHRHEIEIAIGLLLFMLICTPLYTVYAACALFIIALAHWVLLDLFSGRSTESEFALWLHVWAWITVLYFICGYILTAFKLKYWWEEWQKERRKAKEWEQLRKASQRRAENTSTPVQVGLDSHPLPPDLIETLKKPVADFRECGMFEAVKDDWNLDMLRLIVSVSAPLGPQKPVHAAIYKCICKDRITDDEAVSAVARYWPAQTSEFISLQITNVAASYAILLPSAVPGTLQVLSAIAQLAVLASGAEATLRAEMLRTYMEFISKELEEKVRAAEAAKSRVYPVGDAIPSTPKQIAYALLGVTHSATHEEIKAAYRQKVQEWHPDQLERMAPELKAFANEQLARINTAYKDLSTDA